MIHHSSRVLNIFLSHPLFFFYSLIVLFASSSSSYLPPLDLNPPISNTPIIICPGFGNDSSDYITPFSQPRSVSLATALERRGFNPSLITTIPIQRHDWLRVVGGILDYRFYLKNVKPDGNAYGWYIKRLKETVDEMYKRSDGKRVILIGHSAGGWLARAAMGDGVWSICKKNDVIKTNERVSCLVTLGAVHYPPVNINRCVTRGALAYVDKMYPGAFLKDEGVRYITVGGDTIQGMKEKPSLSSLAGDIFKKKSERLLKQVVFTSYESVCGKGDVIGDGLVPLKWTQLEGAKQIQLKGVIHSICKKGTIIQTDQWYGSENIIDQWLPDVLMEVGIDTEYQKVLKKL